jgi:ankyrin repeat protein
VRLFLNRGANANAEDNRGRTPLHRVLEEKDCLDEDQFSFTRLLLEHGADVNTPSDDYETPLHLVLVASRLLSLEVAWILLKHGADLNLTNNEGKKGKEAICILTRKSHRTRCIDGPALRLTL